MWCMTILVLWKYHFFFTSLTSAAASWRQTVARLILLGCRETTTAAKIIVADLLELVSCWLSTIRLSNVTNDIVGHTAGPPKMVALIASQAARMLVNDMAELGLVLGADLSVERRRWNPVPWARFLSTTRRSKGVRVIMKAVADSHDSHSHFHHKNNRVGHCLSSPASFAMSTCLGWSFHVVGAERTQKAPQRMRKRSNTDKMRRTTQRRNSHTLSKFSDKPIAPIQKSCANSFQFELRPERCPVHLARLVPPRQNNHCQYQH